MGPTSGHVIANKDKADSVAMCGDQGFVGEGPLLRALTVEQESNRRQRNLLGRGNEYVQA